MKKLSYFLCALILVGCERTTDWDPVSTSATLLVVEGGITNEAKPHRIKLSRTASSMNEASIPVSGAIVTISDAVTTYPLLEDDSIPGSYFSVGEIAGVPGGTYRLSIEYHDTVIGAADLMWSTAPLAPLKYAKVGSTDLYQITWVANSYNPNTAAMYEISLDWSGVPGYADSTGEDCKATLYYFTLTTIDVSNLFSPAIEKTYFPEGTIITERKYSLSPNYEEFMRCLLLETSWRGGLWDAIPGNLPSNMDGPAVGFFNASAVQKATIVVGQ